MRKLFLAACLVGVAAGSTAQAQIIERPRFGVQVSWADDADVGVGAHVDFPMSAAFAGQPLFLQVSGDFFFPGNDVTYFELNGNLLYKFRLQASPIAPYAGGGLNFAYAKIGGGCSNVAGADCSNTDLGLNLVGGIQFPNAGRLLPFVQARFEISGGEQFVLSGGVHF